MPPCRLSSNFYIGRSLADSSVVDAIHADIVGLTEAGDAYSAIRAEVAPVPTAARSWCAGPHRSSGRRLRMRRTRRLARPNGSGVGQEAQKKTLLRQVRPEYPRPGAKRVFRERSSSR
ncbi:MAG: hypothetical protein R2748_17915 [Bryobacterales bacterium]